MTRSISDSRLSIASIRATCAHTCIAFEAGAVVCLLATPAFAATCESPAAVAVKDAKIIASHATAGKVDRTRPLCPYPQVAKYKGTGSIDDAANFVCGVE